MITLQKIVKSAPKKKKRLGLGEGSGRGKNCGKGHKGQIKRGKVRIGFEGGQKPSIRRVPKLKGFKPLVNKQLAVITTTVINQNFDGKEEVTLQSLKEKNIISKKIKKVRVIKSSPLDKKIKFKEDEIYLTSGVKASE